MRGFLPNKHVQMTTDFEDCIVSPALKMVAAHWLAARHGDGIPAWTDLKPAAIKAQLPIVWAYTYDPQTDLFTGRLAGDRVGAVFGKNFRGLAMSDAYPQHDYSRLFDRCKTTLTEPALYHGIGINVRSSETSGTGERIMMPLSSDGQNGVGVFGATEFPPIFSGTIPAISFEREKESWFFTSGAAKS